MKSGQARWVGYRTEGLGGEGRSAQALHPASLLCTSQVSLCEVRGAGRGGAGGRVIENLFTFQLLRENVVNSFLSVYVQRGSDTTLSVSPVVLSSF